MNYQPANPLIVQSDGSLLLEIQSPQYEDVRDFLQLFAELIKSPEYIHTYRVTPLSIWNAASAGVQLDDILNGLVSYAKFPVPENISIQIADWFQLYGQIQLCPSEREDVHLLCFRTPVLQKEVLHLKPVKSLCESVHDDRTCTILRENRGWIKQALMKAGYPVEDLVGYDVGTPFQIQLKTVTGFQLRRYQSDAIESFYSGGASIGSSGVIVLPCGAGKTIVGLGLIARIKTSALIIVNNIEAAHQWRQELIEKTDISPDLIGEYHGSSKNILPITIATYNIITFRKEKTEEFVHMGLFSARDWGLIVYDEVHLLPAPVFQLSAGLQAKRRLGLTATLVREDGKEDEVFSLIGPKKYDVPWKVLENQGWIARAFCNEIRIPFSQEERFRYMGAGDREKFRIASCNPRKNDVVREILDKHPDDHVLIIGQYIQQLQGLADELQYPFISGSTPHSKRDELYTQFRKGIVKRLIVSKVANFSIDLPDANVAVQISGTFGSRQEEAQRLGRIMRPKKKGEPAHFYSIITRDSVEQTFSMKRQLFLTEQGYRYSIINY